MNLILKYKYYIIGAFLSILILSGIVSYFQVGVDRIGDWVFDKKISKMENKVKTLESENDNLRKENLQLTSEKMELEAYTKVLEIEEAKYPKEIESEKQKLEEGLRELDKMEIQAQEYTEPYERCLRINNLIENKLNCEEYRK